MVAYGLWDFWRAGGHLAGYYIRAGSLDAGYGEFGTYLIIVFPFLLNLALERQFLSKKNLAGLLALLALNLLGIYITFGRAMWMAAAAEFFFDRLDREQEKNSTGSHGEPPALSGLHSQIRMPSRRKAFVLRSGGEHRRRRDGRRSLGYLETGFSLYSRAAFSRHRFWPE